MLPSVGLFGNRAPQEERGSFEVRGLPCGLPNGFKSDSSVPLIYWSSDLGPQLPWGKMLRLGEAGGKRNIVHVSWGHVWFPAWPRKGWNPSIPSIQQEQNWTNQMPATLLRSFRELRSRGKPLSPRLERQTDGYRDFQLTRSRSLWRIRYQSQRTQIIIDKLLEAVWIRLKLQNS